MTKAFQDTLLYLYSLIPQDKNWVFSGQKGLDRAKYLLDLIGNPQKKLKIIHIAGTSGKGSTAFYTSSLLQGLGFKAGLHISPHLFDIRERVQINNSLISEKEYVSYVNKLKPFIRKTTQSPHGAPTYFEVLVALAFYIFQDKKVDYAVMETGVGGWYDATNTVDRADKLSLITSIGLDHTHVLGKTVSAIAFQKAKIITQNGIVIAQENVKTVRNVIKREAKQKNAHIYFLPTSTILSSVKTAGDGLFFDYTFQNKTYKKIKLSTHAIYQAENVSLAMAAMQILSKRDGFEINEIAIRHILSKTHFAGRMEELNIQGKKIILDGAHNPQKMLAFLTSLQKAYPNGVFHFLIAFKKGKDIKKMIKLIEPLASSLTITNFILETQDLIHTSEDPSVIASSLKGLAKTKIIPDYKKAFESVFLKTPKSQIMVVTGSLYLLSMVYNSPRFLLPACQFLPHDLRSYHGSR